MLSLSTTRSYGEEYDSFINACPVRKVGGCIASSKIQVEDISGRCWLAYDAGPREVPCPLVMLPPLSGRANCYYKQIMGLSALGYRVISLDWPPCWSVGEFVREFQTVLDLLGITKCHIFGSSLGGYLAQRVAEQPRPSNATLVQSLILCNTFTDTTIFKRNIKSFTYWAMPAVYLKQMIMSGFPAGAVRPSVAESIDFMVDNLDSLSQSDLASRLTLNCSKSCADIYRVSLIPITILSVFDDCALTSKAVEHIHSSYPKAKRAHMKSGGNFPFISQAAETNMHIQVHLRPFCEDQSLSPRSPNQSS